MLAVPKYEGLDLPIHDSDSLVATGFDMNRGGIGKITEDYTVPTFLRAIDIQLRNLSHAPESAAQLLEKTDEELKRVAELCGTLIVGHEWGLYPIDRGNPDYRRYLPAAQGLGGIVSLPRDHILVAEVSTIRPANLDMPGEALVERQKVAHKTIEAGVGSYYEQGTYQLFDMRSQYQNQSGPRVSQFMIGSDVNLQDAAVATHLIDIEPRFSLTR